MGCDIHVWTEARQAGVWRRVDVPGWAPLAWHNNRLFAFLGDVRNTPQNPWGVLAPAPFSDRGLPDDMDRGQWGPLDHGSRPDPYPDEPDEWHPLDPDLHSHSWGSLAEFLALEWPDLGPFRDSLDTWIPTVRAFADAHGLDYEDLRLVYAFDN